MREQILHMLVEAAEIEHNLLCSYLYAAFSLRERGEGLDDEAQAAVGRWRRTILEVAVQEMGHFATVNNLIVALGGSAHFDRPNFPVPAGYHPPGFDLRLTPFDEATLEHFIFLERPEDAPLRDADGFRSDQPARESARISISPASRDYATIGDLYGTVRRDLARLVETQGPRAFVCSERQAGAELLGVKGVLIIRDLATAQAALRHIVEEGEGGAGAADSHFAKFCAIREEWAGLKARDPAFRPAHPAARDPVMREPAKGQERVWITSPAALPVLDLGNALYGALLLLLAELYQAHDPAVKKRVAGAAIDLMHALSHAARCLARLPASPDAPGVNAGLTFAVPRAKGPRAGLALVGERLSELCAAYGRVFPGQPNLVEKISLAER